MKKEKSLEKKLTQLNIPFCRDCFGKATISLPDGSYWCADCQIEQYKQAIKEKLDATIVGQVTQYLLVSQKYYNNVKELNANR